MIGISLEKLQDVCSTTVSLRLPHGDRSNFSITDTDIVVWVWCGVAKHGVWVRGRIVAVGSGPATIGVHFTEEVSLQAHLVLRIQPE